MLAALNFVLGASIRRLWALRTQRKSIERDVCAPVVLAHQHVVAPIWVQRDPERINHNHKSRSIGYKPLRSEDEPVHIEGSFCWCWSSREGGVGLVSEWAFWKLKHRTFCLTVRCSSDVLKKTSPLDVFGDVSEKVKHLTNDASNDVSPPALCPTGGSPHTSQSCKTAGERRGGMIPGRWSRGGWRRAGDVSLF